MVGGLETALILFPANAQCILFWIIRAMNQPELQDDCLGVLTTALSLQQ
jgi:hypothetical protein